MMIAALNPCPCGFYGDPFHECSCSPHQIHKYLAKISGPLIDRIDLQLEVAPVKFSDLQGPATTDSTTIKKRVEAARLMQLERYKVHDIYCNSQLTPKLMSKHCKLDKSGKLLMKAAFHSMKLSARAHNKILKVARTIADLDNKHSIKEYHLAEALQYRNVDKYY